MEQPKDGMPVNLGSLLLAVGEALYEEDRSDQLETQFRLRLLLSS
jgi:hypothetical protein